MTVKLKNDKGEEQEVMTPEELDAHIEKERKAAAEEATKNFKDYDEVKKGLDTKSKELDDIKSQLETAKEALGKADKGTQDWNETRNTIKTLEKSIKDLTKERDEIKDTFSKEIRDVRTSMFKSQLNSWMDHLSGGDAEIKKKMEFQYNRLGADVKDEKEAQEIVKDAYLLATGKNAPNFLNVARGFSGEAPRVKEPASAEVLDLGRKFGISDEDVKKFSARAAEKRPGFNNQ